MIKRIVPAALVGATVLGFTACKPGGGFKTTKDGLEYNIVKDVAGDRKPQLGDIIEMHVKTRIGDSALFDSYKMNNNQPVQFPLMAGAFKGDLPDGLMMLTPGDSAVFRVSLDSVRKKGAQLPPWVKPTDKMEYQVKLISVKTQAEMKKEMEQKSAGQRQTDDKILQDYFTQNKITPAKTASGLYYVMSKEGAGETAKPGQTVTVNYTGKLLDGTPFDSNVDPQFQHVEPFPFMLGQGQVIPGWDEGVALMKKGGKATFYIPSTLAYGPEGREPKIPANAILVFEVEVTDIK
jgi:FKBP-type peptidyl-prolyl cis-trans isomerase